MVAGHAQQRGQAMVEYVVILAALTAALLLAGNGSVEDLRQAVVDRHRGQSYALSLSEIPETDDLELLAEYYRDLGKYPELADQLGNAGGQLGQLADQLEATNRLLGGFDPAAIADAATGYDFRFDLF